MDCTPPKCTVVKSLSSSNITHAILEWTIEGMTLIRDATEALQSDPLSFTELGYPDMAESWVLVVHPKFGGTEKKSGENSYTGVFLAVVDMDKHTKVRAKYAIQVFKPIAGSWKVVSTSYGSEHETAPYALFASGGKDRDDWGNRKALPHADLFKVPSDYLRNDALTVKAEIEFFIRHQNQVTARYATTAAPSSSTGEYHQYAAHCARLLELYRSKEDSDVIVVSSDDKEFHVHRAVLRTHSSVFSKLLKQVSTKAERLRLQLDDVDGKTLDALLEYLYGCGTGQVSKLAEKVMEAADAYKIPELGAVAIENLAGNITAQNAVRLLLMAERRGLENLERAAMEFIAAHLESIIETGGMEAIHQHSKDLRTKLWKVVAERKTAGSKNPAASPSRKRLCK